MSSFTFKFAIVALAYALLVSAGVPHKRSTQWLKQNGPAAKALNDKYATLALTSPCNYTGALACINNELATCYEGRYVLTACPHGWSCAAIPNDHNLGTTTTCDPNDDILWRFSQAGISETKRWSPPTVDISWLQKNGPTAKALNDAYATLTTNSSCTSGTNACVGGKFGHCVMGRYRTWACKNGTSCAAIPNERNLGTTTACDRDDDIAWRFSQANISRT